MTESAVLASYASGASLANEGIGCASTDSPRVLQEVDADRGPDT